MGMEEAKLKKPGGCAPALLEVIVGACDMPLSLTAKTEGIYVTSTTVKAGASIIFTCTTADKERRAS